MTITVGGLWALYIIVVVVVFIILWWILGSAQRYYRSAGHGMAFLLATILGVIAVLIGSAWINASSLSSSEQTALSVLYLVVFLLPIIVILYIVWAGEYASFTGEDYLVVKSTTVSSS